MTRELRAGGVLGSLFPDDPSFCELCSLRVSFLFSLSLSSFSFIYFIPELVECVELLECVDLLERVELLECGEPVEGVVSIASSTLLSEVLETWVTVRRCTGGVRNLSILLYIVFLPLCLVTLVLSLFGLCSTLMERGASLSFAFSTPWDFWFVFGILFPGISTVDSSPFLLSCCMAVEHGTSFSFIFSAQVECCTPWSWSVPRLFFPLGSPFCSTADLCFRFF